MQIELSVEEVEMVRTLVEERIRGLGPEIHHTSHRDFREGLKDLQRKLEQLDERLIAAGK